MFNHLKAIATGIFLTGCFLSTTAQYKFVIKGHVTDTARDNQKITLTYSNGAKRESAATMIKNGYFEFKGSVVEPVKATLSTSTPRAELMETWTLYDITSFYLAEGLVELNGRTLASAEVKSDSKAQQDFQALQKELLPFLDHQKKANQELLKAAQAKDSVTANTYRAVIAQQKEKIDSVEEVYLTRHTESFVSLGLLKDRITSQSLAEDKEKLSGWFNALSTSLKTSSVGKLIDERIQQAYKLSVGKPSIDFVLKDTLDNPVSLSSFRGKYVLLDFWASWCIPCRFENKTVLKAYDRYKDRNFTVLGVSLEQPGAKKAWLAAIHQDGLKWTQVADLVATKNPVAEAYGVQSIPMNFLIDPQGTIIGVHLRGEALLNKLDKVLPK